MLPRVDAAQRWRKRTDLGVTTVYYGPARSAAERAVLVAIDGWRFGYPSCCIEEFVDDIEHGRHPAVRRGSLPTATGGRYVPCSLCCEAIGREVFQ